MWKILAALTSVFFLAIVGLAQANDCGSVSQEVNILGYIQGVMVEADGNCLLNVEIQFLSQNEFCPMWSLEGVTNEVFSIVPVEKGCPTNGGMIGFTVQRLASGEIRLVDLVF